VHKIESGTLDSLAGKKLVYSGHQELRSALRKLLGSAKKVAMQYSPMNAIMYVAMVDAGSVELIKSCGPRVVSSADLVQKFEAAWTPQQTESHLAAGKLVDRVTREAFAHAAENVKEGLALTEIELIEWMRDKFEEYGLETAEGPHAAVGSNAGDPHYEPTRESARKIQEGDLLLLDVWGKLKTTDSVYYDITWMGYLGATVPEKYAKKFSVVREARDRAVAFVQENVRAGRPIAGWQVDRVAREVIRKAGLGKFFVHRTGHSLGRDVHGAGANMDDLESHDVRRVIPNTCFSIEPGVYFPGFGIRSEVNVLVEEKDARVTGAMQTEILALLA
jgi:Xaa-Pro aminopeptidase